MSSVRIAFFYLLLWKFVILKILKVNLNSLSESSPFDITRKDVFFFFFFCFC